MQLTSGGSGHGDFDWKASVLSNLGWVGLAYVVAIGLIFGWRWLSRAGQTHPGIDAWMQRLPLAGPVRRSRSLARFCEVLHIYLLSGQRMDRAWEKAGDASQGGQLRSYARQTAPRLAAGESVSDVVAAAGGAARACAPSSLPALAETIRQAALFVAADTGPLHLAALVETPLLGLFGPKDPAIYGPYGVRADGTPGVLPVLTQDDVACRPCTLRRCADPLCMRTLDPDRVHGAVQALQR